MVSVCLPSDALLQHLPSYSGFSYLGHGVSLHGCSSKAQPLLLTLNEGYLLTAALPDLQCGIATTSVFLPWEPHEQYEKAKDRTLKEELPRSVGVQYATGDQWRNNSRKNEEIEPKQKQHPVVDVTGDGSKVHSCKVQCCKEQYCIGTWNVKSMNQGKLLLLLSHFSHVRLYVTP